MSTPASDNPHRTLPAWMGQAPGDRPVLRALAGEAVGWGARRREIPVPCANVGGPGGQSPTPSQGSSSNSTQQSTNTPHGDTDELQAEPPHSSGGLSGSEDEVDLMDFPDDPSDPEEAPSEPLADEKKAIVVYAARNLLNTVDIRPTGHAWFSA